MDAMTELFSAISTIGCDDALKSLQEVFSELARELAWLAPGHAAAVEATVLRIFVLALRLKYQASAAASAEAGREQTLVARFRGQVEQHFRAHMTLETYTQALDCSHSRLHRACRHIASQTPLEIIQARLFLEAKRALLYSDMTIAEVAIDLGFADPAYFSRFFSRKNGGSAKAFRRSRSALA